MFQVDLHFLFIDSTFSKDPDKLLYAGNAFWKKQGLNSFEKSTKVVLGKKNEMSNPSYLLGRSHLFLKNSVICFNHSSHEDHLINSFQNKIALINKAWIIDQDHMLNYDKIVINTQLNYDFLKLLKTEYPRSVRPKIHHSGIDGYYQIVF